MFDYEIISQNFPKFLAKSGRVKKAKYFAGVDEVGRGPLAGPVVAAAAIIKSPSGEEEFENFLGVLENLNINDSKKLSRTKRLRILEQLEIDCSKLWQTWDKQSPLFLQRRIANIECQLVLTFKDQHYIDQFNILQAALAAMGDALLGVADGSISDAGEKQHMALIDGNKIPKAALEKGWQCLAVVKGDQKSLLIGLASIFAKEMRDFWMEKIDEEYPGYGFGKHAGYPTREHLAAIKKLGPCTYHRRSFRGVVS
jgi:ribonuclease HII